MSLIEMRSRWLRATRGARAAEEDKISGERLLVAATFTVEPLIPYLGIQFMVEDRRPPTIDIAPYDQVLRVCLEWPGPFADRIPSAVILLWRIEDAMRVELLAAARGDATALPGALTKLEALRAAVFHLRNVYDGVVVVSLPPFPHGPDHDLRAARSAVTVGAFHRRIVDAWIAALDPQSAISTIDLDACQRMIGVDKSYDARKWYLYRQPYTEEFWHETAQALGATLRRQRAAAKKCLIVDCDNTLWGGVIGEDGLQGIALGQDFPGSAFTDFQNQLVTLRSKGAMLAIASKNNEQDVWEVFDRHDGMVLRRDDFVASRINWRDKADNIESIARELNIGLDSLVFVDDSALEIESVRARLPMVACLQVPSDPARLAASIGALGLFDREHVSEEDRSRSTMMNQERERHAFGEGLTAREFEAALGLSVDVFEAQPEHHMRIVQLINKTNQFNLTTIRRTAGEIAALCASPGVDVLAWRVADRFGDYGLVGVAILKAVPRLLEIETLLMSCRVLGRGVETAVIAAIADVARRRGLDRLQGRYIATQKNVLVRDFYRNCGFESQDDIVWESRDLEFAWPPHVSRAAHRSRGPGE